MSATPTRPDESDARLHAGPGGAPAIAQPARRAWLQRTGAAALAPLLAGCGGGEVGAHFPHIWYGGAPTDKSFDEAIAWGREQINLALGAGQAPAVSVALLSGNKVLWQQAFGWVDRAAGLAASTATRFNVGSVSKVLAALAVTVLVDRGRVRLDDPVVRHLPEFRMLSPEYRQITLRQLLDHSSGLPGTHPRRNVFAFSPYPGYAAEVEVALADVHLKHVPGLLAVYCNDGFTLVERVVLAVTGKSYPEFVHEAILAPLGMNLSDYALAPAPAGSVALPHADGKPLGQEFVNAHATGGLCTTPGDMMKLAAMLLSGGVHEGRRIVSEAGIAEMGRDQTTGLLINPSPEWRWGLGWDSVRHPGLDAAGIRAWQKNGGTTFFNSEFFVLPEARLGLLLTGSGMGYGPTRIAEGVLLRALRGSGTIRALPQPLDARVPGTVSVPSAQVRALAGIYGNYDAPLKVHTPDGERLDLLRWRAGQGGQPGQWREMHAGLRLRRDGWWWSEADASMSYRWEQVQGHRYLIARRAGGAGHYQVTLPLGEQMPAASSALPAAWAARVGSRWEVTNEAPDSTAHLGGTTPFATLGELPELPGYVLWEDGLWGTTQLLRPLSDERAGMAVQVPVNNGRDLAELVIENRGGQLWMHAAGWLYRRLEG